MSSFRFEDHPHLRRGERLVTVPAGIETREALFAYLKGAIPLPDYFGGNWDALEECLADLEWLRDFKVILSHEDIPLSQSPREQHTYLEILALANQHRMEIVFPIRVKEHLAK